MLVNDPTARIPCITADERTDEIWELIKMFSGPGRLNVDENHVLNTLGQHPELAKVFLSFNRYLLMSSTLPVRLRQVAILRICWVKKARYMWSSHLRTSLRNGFSGEEFEHISQGPSDPYWTKDEKVVLRATDELMDQSDLSDATWTELSLVLDRKAVMDLIFTVGNYVLLAMGLNAMRVERESALLELAEKYGSPV